MKGFLLSAALVSLLLPAHAETVRVNINGTVTANAVCIFPGEGPGSPAQISFLASSNGNGGYSMISPSFTVGSITYGMNTWFSMTNGTNADHVTVSGGGLNVNLYNYMSVSISDPSGNALRSSVLGDNLGSSTGWGGNWRIIVSDFGTVGLAVDVTEVTIDLIVQNRWVSASAGNNSNTGASPTEAWRTLSYAAANSGQGDTIRVLPGTYDAALGETFPITLPSDVNLTGENGGPAMTVVAGDGTTDGLHIASASDSIISNLRFTGFDTAIEVMATGIDQEILMQHVEIADSTVGIDVQAQGAGRNGVITLEAVRVEDCTTGVRTVNDIPLSLSTNRCLFRSCSTGYQSQTLASASSDHVIEQSLFLLNDFAISANGPATVRVMNSLVAQNTQGIVSTALMLSVEGSTVADNQGAGIFGADMVEGSIVMGNGTDLVGTQTVSNSNVGTPGFAGTSGNISEDPQFKNPAFGDYRLTFTSPCIDTAAPTIDFDIALLPRMGDGDLNGNPARDMGAFELQTLELGGTPVVGTTIPLLLNGPPGGYGVLFSSSIAVDPLLTPLGLWYLPQNQMIPLARVHFDANGASTVNFFIPNLPEYVGTELFFQGIMRSPTSAVSIAATDLLTLVVQP